MDSSSRRPNEEILNEVLVVEIEESSSGDDESDSIPTTPNISNLSLTRNQSHGITSINSGSDSTQPHSYSESNLNIRTRIETARTLLEGVELSSRPVQSADNSEDTSEPRTSSDLGLTSRYAVSRHVKANDFYQEIELASLCDITSVLKNRLSVERIYHLGPPQSPEEREIFDELLMTQRFSNLIAVGENRTLQAATSVRSEASNVLNGTETRNQENETVGGLLPTSTRSNDNELESSFSVAGTSGTINPIKNQMQESSRMLHCVQSLRRYVEESPETVVGDRELVNIVSEFIQCLRKSPVLSSAIAFSPSKTLTKSRKRQRNADDSCEKETCNDIATDDDEESCTICLEPWTSGGDHRICCLKCGHMFGYSCICKWIKQAHSCPQCKMLAKKDDIRNLFARRMTVEDTSERDRALRLLEEEKVKARSLEHKEAVARRNVDSQRKLISTLEARLTHMESVVSSQGRAEDSGAIGGFSSSGGGSSFASGTSYSRGSNNNRVGTGGPVSSQLTEYRDSKYQHLARISIAQEGHCRVFEHSKEMGMVVVSTKSTNALFRGFGIKTLSRDFRVLSYQPLHSALIRDMSFRPNTFDGTLLSCGMDKVVQLTSVTSKCVIQKFSLTASGWCCAWNPSDNNLFYVGMERGVVKEFDIRRTDSPIHDVLDLGGAPISSVSYWDEPSNENSSSRSVQGLLIAQIRNLIFREKRENEFSTHLLPCPQAPMIGTCMAPEGYFLTSFRPTSTNPRCQYEVCRLIRGQDNSIFSSKVTSWEGGTLQAVISRNSLFLAPNVYNRLLAVTANHQSNTVSVWDVNRKQELQVLNSFDKAIDIKPILSNQQAMLGVLSDSELVLYKWQ